MTNIVEQRSKDNCVICPACNHEFVAVPVDVQEELASLRQQLADCETKWNDAADCCAKGTALLAECQAREKVLLDAAVEIACCTTPIQRNHELARFNVAMQTITRNPDSTALDAMLKHAKREALLEAAERMKYHGEDWAFKELLHRAKELE
jgi:uncharacterized Zn finger protein (UPF0148 family)